ncbi:T9SS type A sorting domain-containing protein [Pontibacter cellulosilyticus]|uniref:T9SS type A sorting domain-containing protein n=1 Tax=Pontibacter cellulosilyticus TaxID=1720253 RepID=A0A923SH80_9BACT|nr:T9SS type A sorting domain-containing protein [Pontibacter cellulosilyticus]MBC5991403.1 T9SS type A sorting domain-containing protein [Pontibacter cellulosilyticus]
MKTFTRSTLCLLCATAPVNVGRQSLALTFLLSIVLTSVGTDSFAQLSRHWMTNELKAGSSNVEAYVAHALDRQNNLIILGINGTTTYPGGVPVSDTRITYYVLASSGTILTAKVINLGNNSLWDTPVELLTDKIGNSYILGKSTFSDKSSESFIAKITERGEVGWIVSKTGEQSIKDFTLGQDGNLYYVGTATEGGKTYVRTVKLSSDGSEVWDAEYFGRDNNGATAQTLEVDNNGGVFIATYSEKFIPTVGYETDVILAKYNAMDGREIFVESYKSGKISSLYDFETPVKILPCPSSDVYLISQQSDHYLSTQILIYRISNNGELTWLKGGGQFIDFSLNSPVAVFKDILLSEDESLVLHGMNARYRNFPEHFLTKFSSSGDRMWYRSYNEYDRSLLRQMTPHSLAVGESGDIAITGSTRFINVFNPFPPIYDDLETDVIQTILYNKDGEILWKEKGESLTGGFSFGYGVSFLADADLYLVQLESDASQGPPSYSHMLAMRYSAGCVSTLPATAGEDKYICNGEGVVLAAGGGVKYSWSPAEGLSRPDLSNTTANPSKTTTYTVTVTDECGNVDTDEVTVFVGEQPVNVKLYLPPMAKRVGWQVRTTADFGSFTNLQGANVRWTWGDGSNSTIAYTLPDHNRITGEHTYQKAGIYTIGLDLSKSCLRPTSDDYTQQMIIYDPEAGYVTGEGNIKNANAALRFMDRNRISSYTFSIGYAGAYSIQPQGYMKVMLNNKVEFSSTSIDWLVIDGNRAAWQGWGTINGMSYKFVSTIEDGGRQGKNDPFDKLRFQIWSAGGTLVFDNYSEGEEGLSLTQPLPKIIVGQVMINGNSPAILAQEQQKASVALSEEPVAYPNPFSSEVRLTFAPQEEGKYEVVLFDARGSLIGKIATGEARVGKAVTIEIDGTHLAEGIYFARLSVAGSAKTIKLLLQR